MAVTAASATLLLTLLLMMMLQLAMVVVNLCWRLSWYSNVYIEMDVATGCGGEGSNDLGGGMVMTMVIELTVVIGRWL